MTGDPLARETPPWFDEAKLGIFVTWSPAAIPAFAPLNHLGGWAPPESQDHGARDLRRLPYAEMYRNTMAIEGSPTARYHAERYGDMPYDEFVKTLREEMIPRFDPEALADAIAASGARYAVFFARHEDGFLWWPSAHPNPRKGIAWQSPRDVAGELGSAVRDRGIRYGIAYCGAFDWTLIEPPMTSWAAMAAMRPQGREYVAYVDAHWRELIDRYAPDVIWNDYSVPRGLDVAALFRHYLQRVPDGVINNRWNEEMGRLRPSEVYSDFVTPEYSTAGPEGLKWEACRGIGTSFGYNRLESDETYLSARELIHMLVDVVARGGNLLLNVGPTATGEVPWAQAQRLLELGWWLRVNGEAIYGTRPWDRVAGLSGEGLEVRYTASPDAVHAIVLGTPLEAAVEVDVRLREGARVRLAGRPGELAWAGSPAGVRVELPEPPCPQPALALTVEPRSAVTSFAE